MNEQWEERWESPGQKCDLCMKPRSPGDDWWDEHWTAGGSGFNFVFCHECSENRRGDCDVMAAKVVGDWTQKCRDYWAKNPPIENKIPAGNFLSRAFGKVFAALGKVVKN